MLIVSVVLSVLPLIGIGYMFVQGSIDTVDNLFYILILLAMSGIFGLSAYLEYKDRKKYAFAGGGLFSRAGTASSARWAAAAGNGLQIEAGLVESVVFFETAVGSADRSIVTLRPKRGNEVRVLTFEGDLRNQLPVGHTVQVTFGPGINDNRVLALSYK